MRGTPWRLAAALLVLLAVGCKAEPPAPLRVRPVEALLEGEAWWRDAVFYEVFVRSYRDTDGDGIGDLRGLIARLDYLNDGDPATTTDLGVTGLWLMPIHPATSYHGYDVTDYFDVHPDYGTLDDMRALVEEAHKRGIRVIVDLVLNHTSSEHPWFRSAVQGEGQPCRDCYLWSATDPGVLGPMGAAWHPSPTGYYYGVFWSGMPDLNLANPQIAAQMRLIPRFWLDEIGVDGFRLDAARYLVEQGADLDDTPATHDWLKGFFAINKGIEPEAYLVGEVTSPLAEIREYGPDELDMAFEFETARAIVSAAKTGLAGPVIVAQDMDRTAFPGGRYATFITNHDQNRAMSELGGDQGRAKVAASLLLTGPGVPFIYYGEEVGLQGVKPDEDIRLPMPWNAEPGVGFTSGTPWRAPYPDPDGANVAAQTLADDSLLSHYRRLIALRNQHAALRTGEWVRVRSASQSIHAFLRRTDEETLLVLINLGAEPVASYGLSLAEGKLPGRAGVELFSGATVGMPKAKRDGGFSGYLPLPELAGYATYIIQYR